MKDLIYIIGYGAVGKALAVVLKRNGRNVIILRGSVDDSPAVIGHIQVAMPDQPILEAEIEINTVNQFDYLNGIIVLTNKSYGNQRIAEALKNKTKDSPIVLLQNGLGVEEVFVKNGFPEIYRCVLFITSQVISPGKVSYKPVAVSPIGTVTRHSSSLDQVVASLSCPDFPFRSEPVIEPIIWKKAIVNSVFNSVCPLLNVDNGIFQRDEVAFGIAKRVIKECVSIAQARGVALSEAEVTESLLLISRLSDGQLISTLQDINNKRRTEIDTLNFAIARIAKDLNREDSVKETRLLGELTRLKSDLNR